MFRKNADTYFGMGCTTTKLFLNSYTSYEFKEMFEKAVPESIPENIRNIFLDPLIEIEWERMWITYKDMFT